MRPHRLEHTLPALMARHGVPGLALAVIEEATLAWAGGFGVADRATGRPVTADTVFEAASLSKPVVAYAVLGLARFGALDLDANLTALPGPEGFTALEGVTARRVLCHTSGLPNWLPDGEAPKPRFAPGSRFSYSGVGYRLLQRAIEGLTGQPLAGFLEREVFGTLQMADSSFVWKPDYDHRCATGHDAHGEPAPKSRPAEAHAAFSLHSTAPDLARFVIATMRPDGLGALMLEPHTAVNDDAPWRPGWPQATVQPDARVHWGLGWGLERASTGLHFWQWGDNTTFKALAIGSRDTGRAVVALTNSQNGSRMWPQLVQETLGGDHPALGWLERVGG